MRSPPPPSPPPTPPSPRISTSSAIKLYDIGKGRGCLDGTWGPPVAPGGKFTELDCNYALLPQLNRCCKSGICKPDPERKNDTWGICQKCNQNLDCNLVPGLISEMSEIKCETKKDAFGKSGKFCNNITFTAGNDPEYLKPCTENKDCIIPCNIETGLCEYSTKLGKNEKCVLAAASFTPATGISQDDPRYQQCLKKFKNLDPCSKATTQIGCTRSAKNYDCFVGDTKIGTQSVGCMLIR